MSCIADTLLHVLAGKGNYVLLEGQSGSYLIRESITTIAETAAEKADELMGKNAAITAVATQPEPVVLAISEWPFSIVITISPSDR